MKVKTFILAFLMMTSPFLFGHVADEITSRGNLGASTLNGVSNTNTETVVLFSDNFDDNNLDGWTLIDANGDGYNWAAENGYIFSKSYVNGSAITTEDYIITEKAYQISEASVLTFKVVPTHSSYNVNNNYGVIISEDNINFDIISSEKFDDNNNITKLVDRTVELTAYAGKTLYIGFLHHMQEKEDNSDGIKIDDVVLTGTVATAVAKIGTQEFETLADAIAKAKSGDEIIMLDNATLGEELTIPAGITLNGNGYQIEGSIVAAGDLTFAGHTKVTSFNAGYNKPVITIGEGACLEMNGTGRMVIGHGATFNINGTIADAKTAAGVTRAATDLTPSLIMPGASFTGAGVTFNVNNAYIKTTASYCSSSKSASGTFDFNIENSIWEQFGKLAFESQSTAATVNFELKNSVLTTTSHLVFGVSRGEIIIDNSYVNKGTTRQIENQSTMTVKNGSVVNGAVATSSNAKNPGTLIVDNATYSVTGEFSGSDLGTGTLIMKNGASFTAGSITKANIQIDAEGLAVGNEININAKLDNHVGTLEVINNNNLDAKIENGKIVLVEKPVAQIGNKGYNSLLTALSEAKDNETVVMNVDVELTTRLIFASYTNGKQVTLDGNGNRLYASSTNWGTGNGKHLINVNCDNVTLRNVVLDCNNIAEGANIYKAQNIVFDNVSIINKKGWNADLTVNGSTLTVENKLSASYVDIDLGSGVTTPLGIVAAEGAVLDTKTLQIDAAAYPNTNLDNALSTDGTSYYSLKKVDANGNLTGYSNSLSRLSSGYGYEMLEDMTVNSDVTLLNAGHTGTLNTNGHTLTIADGKSLTVNGALNVEGEGTIKGNIILGNSDASVSGVEGLEIKSTVEGAEVVYQDGKYIVAIYVAQVGDTKYDDLQEAIVAAAPAGEVNILSDITVDKWIMFSERLSIGSGQIITINKIDGLTINGNNHSLTINSIESASNGNRLFYDATELNIKDLTINYKEGVVGGIGLTSGTINKVTFNGGVGVLPGTGEITISGCTFNTSGSAIYNEEDRDNLVVTGNTFNTAEGQYAIYLRGNTTFTNNIVKVGKVNVTNSGTGLISGNDFGTERFKVYNAATATIEDNKINNLVFNDESVVCSTFGENELSAEAQAVLDAASFPVAQIGTTKYGTLQEAVNVGGNITILSDITLTETVKVAAGKTVTLDLNGKTIDYNPEVWTYGAANSGTALLTVNFGGNLTIEDSSAEKTGTIDASYREENWDNYTYDVYGAVMMTAAGDNAENGTAKLTVNGGTLKGFFAAVAGNRNRDNTDITINDGYLTVEISDKFSTTGIEHPMNGKLTISGGKIEGMDGISFRSGTLVITGGTIIGNAPESAFEPDGYWDNNFAACTGHALQIVNRANSEPTNETPNVTITGGTFIAENTTAVASYAGYKGNTPDTQIVNFVSGGTFNGEIEQNLLAEGYELVQNENGTYGVERNYQIWDGISINTDWYNTTDTEFILYTADDLAGFAAIANGTADGISADYFEGKTIKLGADIDLNNQPWAPIGGRTSSTLSGQIECTFDGQGYTISNLKVKKGEAYEAVNMNIGLFGITRTGKFVAKNFILENVDVYGSASVAAVLGRTVNCKAVIENVTVKGLIKLEASTQNIAAICAQAYMPVINNCHVIGSDGSYIKAGTVQVGGIVGWSGESSKVTSITECSIENVTISANAYVGAIASILQYGATATNNNAKNVVLNVGEDEYHYGTIVGSVGAGYIANNGNPTAPVTLNENTTENVTVTLKGTTVESPIEYGAHYDKDTYLTVRIGNDYYEDLSLAFNAGGNITILRDVNLTEGLTVAADKVVTLDLNGNTITGTPAEAKTFAVITNKGNLTIVDNTEAKEGKIVCDHKVAGSTAYAVNTITNGGTLTIEAGAIENKSTASNQIGYAIDNNSTTGNAIVVIKGGKVTASGSNYYDGIRQFCNSETLKNSVTIEGGEVTSLWLQNPSDGSVDRNTKDVKGSFAISGGTLNNLYLEPSAAFSGSITGGHVGSVSAFETAEGRDLTGFITGGTFGKDVTEFLAEGYTLVKDEDGTYGVINDPNIIDNLDELIAFRDAVNAGNTYAGKTVTLAADIDLADGQTRSTESNWTPIGNSSNKFQGTFDGQNHTISNLVINGGSSSDQGFFGFTTDGEIKNVTFENAKVSGRLNVGVVAGTPYTSKYTNIKVTGHVEVNGMAYVGGVGGKNAYADWTDITVNVDETSYVKAVSTENGVSYRTYVGGVIGFNGEGRHTFKNISSNIHVIGDICDIGGIFGIAHYGNKVENVSCSATVESTGEAKELGGIAGVWHNEKGTSVTMNDVAFTGTVKDVNGEVAGVDYVGGAYHADNETSATSGSLVINGQEAWLLPVKIGDTKYRTLAEAATAAENGATIELLWAEGNAPIAMNADLYGKNVTITGTATVDWSKNFLFVGRGGEGNATLTFDNANLTSASNSASYGIHVSGREKNTNNKYDGTLIIKNSTIELDYLINKGAITLDNSEFTVKNGFSIGGRPASETESGVDATATITLNNCSKVIVNNHNGMGLGYEAIGVMNIDATSSFETTQAFLITAKGTMNVNGGNVKVVGTLTNNGTVYVTGEANLDATVTGDGWFYMNGVSLDADTRLAGAKVGFINGTNNIVGSTIKDGFFSVGIGQNNAAATAATFATANNITLGDVTVNVSEKAIVSGGGATYSGWVGSAYSADKTQYTYILNVNSSLATFGYMHVSKDGVMNITGHSDNKYTYDNANVDFYAGELIINGNVTLNGTDAWVKFTKMSVDHADGVLNITNHTNFESSIHNGSTTGTSLKFWKSGEVNVDATSTVEIDNETVLVDGAKLNIAGNVTAKGTVTGAGTINFTDDTATLTAQDGLTINYNLNQDKKVVYQDGVYQVVDKVYVAQIDENNKFESLQEAIAAVEVEGTITLLQDITLVSALADAANGVYNIAADKKITLDLNGKTINATDNSTGNFIVFYNYGEFTIKNGTVNLTATNDRDWNAQSTIILNRGGKLTIESGSYNHNGGTDMAIAVDDSANSFGDAHLYVNGGEIKSTYVGVRMRMADPTLNGNPGNGLVYFEMTAGTIYGGSRGIWGHITNASALDLGSLTITGGTVEGVNHAIKMDADENKNISVAISGTAMIKGALAGDTNDFAITGGTYTVDPSAYCHEDYDAVNTGDVYTIVQIAGTQTREFAYAGWYWFSTYINLEGENGLNTLKDAFNGNATQIKGQEGFTNYYNIGGGAWTNGLTSISAADMYMIKTKSPVTINITGDFVDYEQFEIDLKEGWNWLGFPLSTEVNINDAFANFEDLKSGDMIKGKDSDEPTSYYYKDQQLQNGNTFTGWLPEYTLKPGRGYMFKSSDDKSFVYSSNSTRSSDSGLKTINYNGDNHWFADATLYPNNMSIVAMLSIDGEIVKDNYEIAAFANGECRGSARPYYVEAIDAYMLFMTIHGDEVENLTFKYYDVNYGTEYELNNTMVYSTDAIVGSIEEPYMFNLDILNIEESSVEDINIYPNPTTTGNEINLQAMCDKVEVFNALGVKVAEYTNVDSIDALETAGIYVIRVTIDGNARNCRLVVK